MSGNRIATRYARAFFRFCEDDGVTDDVYREMAQVRELIAESAELADFLDNVALAQAQQQAVVQSLFEGKVSPPVYRLLQFLVERHRLPVLPDICPAFEELYRESRNILEARITSMHPLGEDQVEHLRQKLAARYGKQIEVREMTDVSLLGGFIVKVRDTVYDFSVHGKLEALRATLCAA